MGNHMHFLASKAPKIIRIYFQVNMRRIILLEMSPDFAVFETASKIMLTLQFRKVSEEDKMTSHAHLLLKST